MLGIWSCLHCLYVWLRNAHSTAVCMDESITLTLPCYFGKYYPWHPIVSRVEYLCKTSCCRESNILLLALDTVYIVLSCIMCFYMLYYFIDYICSRTTLRCVNFFFKKPIIVFARFLHLLFFKKNEEIYCFYILRWDIRKHAVCIECWSPSLQIKFIFNIKFFL